MTVASRIRVVSGASRRIGRAIADGLGRCGASVVADDCPSAVANAVVDTIEDGIGIVRFVPGKGASYTTSGGFAITGGMGE